MSRFNKGRDFELSISREVHLEGVPLLVDPVYLRSLGLGQVDLSKIIDGKIIIYELKHSFYMSNKQKIRLRRSASFLGELFKVPVQTRLLVKR